MSLESRGEKTSSRSILAAKTHIPATYDDLLDRRHLKARLDEAVSKVPRLVLICAPPGYGKTSLIADWIRSSSTRHSWLTLDSGDNDPAIFFKHFLESIFGGADSARQGKFHAAHSGTIFLDEVAVASPGLQVRLLGVLQDHRFSPVGSNETVDVDVRVILATNKDLAAEVAAGNFREDLYYRINVITVELPPLAERIGDLPLLAGHFLRLYATAMSKPVPRLSEQALAALEHYHWPGNIRELENVLHRAVVLSKGQIIRIEDLPATVVPADFASGRYKSASLKESLERTERKVISAALKANDYNRQASAEALQIERTTLYKKMKRYGLDAEVPARTSRVH